MMSKFATSHANLSFSKVLQKIAFKKNISNASMTGLYAGVHLEMDETSMMFENDSQMCRDRRRVSPINGPVRQTWQAKQFAGTSVQPGP
jgi:hypothetical protein